MAELTYLLVMGNTAEELEKKVNDRIQFGYKITLTPVVITTDSAGTRYYQTMSK